VALKHGEALFYVKHDPSRPFVVEAVGGAIRDIGTRFDVEIVGETVHVAVLQGQVEMSTARGRLPLGAGLAGGYDRTGAFLPVRMLDTTVLPDDRRHFDAEPLADVLERLARHHAVTFIYTDSSLKELRVSGSFRIDDLPAFLRALSVALPIQTRFLDPTKIEVSRRAAEPAPSGH
jgi:transmembrane sensor